MSIKFINVGSSPNDNTGTTIRAGGQLFNNNFATILNALSTDGATLTVNTSSVVSNTYVVSTFAQNTDTVLLINDRLQIANAAVIYATKAELAAQNTSILDASLAFSIALG